MPSPPAKPSAQPSRNSEHSVKKPNTLITKGRCFGTCLFIKGTSAFQPEKQNSCPRINALRFASDLGGTVLRGGQGRTRAPHTVRHSPVTSPRSVPWSRQQAKGALRPFGLQGEKFSPAVAAKEDACYSMVVKAHAAQLGAEKACDKAGWIEIEKQREICYIVSGKSIRSMSGSSRA